MRRPPHHLPRRRRSTVTLQVLTVAARTGRAELRLGRACGARSCTRGLRHGSTWRVVCAGNRDAPHGQARRVIKQSPHARARCNVSQTQLRRSFCGLRGRYFSFTPHNTVQAATPATRSGILSDGNDRIVLNRNSEIHQDLEHTSKRRIFKVRPLYCADRKRLCASLSGPGLLWLRPSQPYFIGPWLGSWVIKLLSMYPGTLPTCLALQSPSHQCATLHVGQGFITPRLCFIELGSAGSAYRLRHSPMGCQQYRAPYPNHSSFGHTKYTPRCTHAHHTHTPAGRPVPTPDSPASRFTRRGGASVHPYAPRRRSCPRHRCRHHWPRPDAARGVLAVPPRCMPAAVAASASSRCSTHQSPSSG